MFKTIFDKINTFDQKTVSDLDSFFQKHSRPFWDKFLAEYLIYFLPIILLFLWFYGEKAKKVALKALFAAILAWPIFANIIGHLINRARPFEMMGVKELIFHRPDYSFPSDHAAALFAVAFSFWFSGYKKLAAAMFVLGIIISFFRVAMAIHFPSDILGGFVLGLVAACLIDLFDKPLDIVYNFIIKFFRTLRLA